MAQQRFIVRRIGSHIKRNNVLPLGYHDVVGRPSQLQSSLRPAPGLRCVRVLDNLPGVFLKEPLSLLAAPSALAMV